MKSIKEKAVEVLPGHCNAYTYESNMKKRIGFNSGANYVLECFESILPFVAKEGIIYGKIKETIEQLKK